MLWVIFSVMLKPLTEDSGVSVIIGALLLILITVIAAAGLAMIVSQAQKQQMERQALEDAIKNEKLNITLIKPSFDESGRLRSVNFSIQNMNINDARIMAVSINDNYALNFTTDVSDVKYNLSCPLVVPATRSVRVHLDPEECVMPVDISNTSTITIQVITSYINVFTGTIKPPSASMKVEVKTEVVGTMRHDYLLLDASESTGETGQIVSYRWKVVNESNCASEYTGRMVRINPDTNGPFNISLIVKDDDGLIGYANDMYVPYNPNFNPAELKIYDIRLEFYPENSSLKALNFCVINSGYGNSLITGVSLNGIDADNFTSNGTIYNYVNPLNAPPSHRISINLSAANFNASAISHIYNTNLITIIVSSGPMEYTKTITPPLPVVRVMIKSESLGSVQRDYLLLDASDSTSETGQIVSYKWKVINESNCIEEYTGKTVRINPASNGPFRIALNVTDDSGLLGASDIIIIPENQNFNPPANIMVVYKENNTLSVKVTGPNNNSLSDIVVNFLVTIGDLILDGFSSTTNADGIASISILNGSGTIHVSAGGAYRDVAWP